MKPTISTWQTASLINNAVAPTAVLSVPPVIIGVASRDAWASVLAAGLASVLMVLAVGAICKANPGQPFVEWLEGRFGKPIGICIGLMLSFYYFNTFCMIVRQFANFMADMVLDQTPIFMLIGIMVAVAAFTVAHGVEAIARSSFIVLLLVMVVIPFSVGLNYPDINLKRLLPLFDADAGRLAYAAFLPFVWLSEVSILFIFSPFMKRPAFIRAGVLGLVLSVWQLVLVVALAITIFGANIVHMMSYPFINMIGIIEVGEFLERIEIFTVSIWGMTMYIKLACFLYAAVHCLSQALHLRSNRHALIGLSVLAVVTSVAAWPRNTEMGNWVAVEAVPFLLLFNIGLPAAIGLGLLVTRGRPRVKEAGHS